MRKYLITESARHELPPITYEEFMVIDLWHDASDLAWAAFKRHNGYMEVDEFREEVIRDAKIEIVAGEPSMEFQRYEDGPWEPIYG